MLGTLFAPSARQASLQAILVGSKIFSFLARVTFSSQMRSIAVISDKSTCGRRELAAAAISGELLTDKGLKYDITTNFWGEFNPSLQINHMPHEPNGTEESGGTFTICHSDTEWRKTRHPARPLLGQTGTRITHCSHSCRDPCGWHRC